MKILVVDDEKLLVKGIKFNLENDGYEVVTGCDGMEAVELAASESPDLIVLDLMMPRLDGLEACTKIREFSQVPIIMLTAKSAQSAHPRAPAPGRRGQKAGAGAEARLRPHHPRPQQPQRQPRGRAGRPDREGI